MRLTWKQILLALVGVAVIVFAGIAHRLEWSGFSFGIINQITLAGLGVLLVWVTLRGDKLDVSRLASGYSAVAVIVLNVIILILLLELVFTIAAVVKFQGTARGDVLDIGGAGLRNPYYANRPGGIELWRETGDALEVQLVPYVRWRLRPYDGDYVNIDADGFRVTPGAQCDAPDAFRVYMFGGSTVWGLGAADNETIPAYLQQHYAAQTTRPVCVVNYGQVGYVSTQDVLTLMRQIQLGTVPNVVIMYGGFNDVFSTSVTREAGSYFYVENEQRDFGAVWTYLGNNSNALQTLFALLESQASLSPNAAMSNEALAEATVEVYMANYNMLAGIAQQYGFEYGVFWQPLVMTVAPDVEGMSDYGVNEELLLAADGAIQALAPETPHLHYVGNVFADVDIQVWYDAVHLVPEGNEIMAQALAAQLDVSVERAADS